ncbi:MAG: Gfo/Idh/MocA family oxidoreductase [Acidobacteria bacterium]|nr:Gfo/Idh/MocA family oxidoreductase [Acidobacteriota bacterium]
MLKAGVVGVGSLGQHHARIFASLSDVKLVGISDSNQERGEEIARRYKTDYFPALESLIEAVDCASVAVPTIDHHRVCAAFLDAGRHVLVEKPIAASPAEARDLITRARRNGRVLQVGHLERCNPAFLAVQRFITTPKFFETHRLGIFVPRSLDIDVVMDLMIHDLDLVLSLSKAEIRDIRAVGIPILTDKIDIANVRLEFESGEVANLTASRVSSEKVRKFRFFQPNDYISLDFRNQSANVYSLCTADTEFGKEIISRNIVVESGEPLRNEIESFVTSITQDTPVVCTGEDGLRALEVAHRIIADMHMV